MCFHYQISIPFYAVSFFFFIFQFLLKIELSVKKDKENLKNSLGDYANIIMSN